MLRSLLFTVVFYLNTAVFLILGSPLLLAPRSWAMAGLRAHARTSLFLQRLIAGTRMEVRGLENLPPGACLIASKHQSAWDTFALVPLFMLWFGIGDLCTVLIVFYAATFPMLFNTWTGVKAIGALQMLPLYLVQVRPWSLL